MSKSLYTSLCLLVVFILGGTVESLAADSGTLKQYLLIAEPASFLAVTDEDFETSIRLRIEDAGGEFVSYSFRGVGAKNYLVVRFPTSSALEAFLGNAADAVEVIEMGPGPTVALAAATAGEEPSSPALGELPKEVAGVQPDVEPAAPPVPGAWKRINSRWVNAEPFTGLFLDFVRFCQGEDSRNQVGDLNDFENPEIRGLRTGFQGTLNFKNPWRWAIFGAYNGFNAGFEQGESPVWSLFDLWVEIPVPKLGFVTVGKAKEPFSMERNDGRRLYGVHGEGGRNRHVHPFSNRRGQRQRYICRQADELGKRLFRQRDREITRYWPLLGRTARRSPAR